MAKETQFDDSQHLVVDPIRWNPVNAPPVPFRGAPGAALPALFDAWIEDTSRALVIGLVVEVDAEAGPGIRAATVQVREGDPPIRASDLKVPWGRYLDAAVERAMIRVTSPTAGTYELRPLSDRDASRQFLGQSKAAHRNRGRTPLTTARLARVAELYREAIDAGEPTGAYVAEALGIEQGTARSYVAKARKAGLLGPADGTRPGEVGR